MKTECTKIYRSFQALGRREIVTDFSGGTITSDGGALLLREVEQRTAILQRFAQCFTDYRKENRIEHNVLSLVSQRVIGLALGYEDLNDHDQLATDQMLAIAVGKTDPTGMDRASGKDKGKPLAGKSTLNRLVLENLHAVHTGHLQVEQHDGGMDFLDDFQCHIAAVSYVDNEADALENSLRAFPNVPLIVHHQNTDRIDIIIHFRFLRRLSVQGAVR